uniref:Uncharacterized protein n=1 Tax=Strigamia maritima TaxID=126957 RepID=T1JI85_STRMM
MEFCVSCGGLVVRSWSLRSQFTREHRMLFILFILILICSLGNLELEPTAPNQSFCHLSRRIENFIRSLRFPSLLLLARNIQRGRTLKNSEEDTMLRYNISRAQTRAHLGPTVTFIRRLIFLCSDELWSRTRDVKPTGEIMTLADGSTVCQSESSQCKLQLVFPSPSRVTVNEQGGTRAGTSTLRIRTSAQGWVVFLKLIYFYFSFVDLG